MYSGWDADAIQGCVCDFPWTGFDCSIRSCEYGPDITGTSALSSASYTYETFTLQCQADAGFFVLLVLGVYTEPIPYNADVGTLKNILMQALKRSQSRYSKVGRRIAVVMEANIDAGGTGNTGSPTVCGGTNSGILTTTIQFRDYIGSRPPMWLSPDIVTSSKTFGTDSQTKLSYLGSTPTLRFVTIYTFTCLQNVNHQTNAPQMFLHFGPNKNASVTPVDLAFDQAYQVEGHIKTIPDFDSATTIYSNLKIVVKFSSSRMCMNTVDAVTKVYIYSDYGNIHGLSFTDSTGGYLSMTSNEGTGTLHECSNNGVCNRETGVCSCFNSKIENRLLPSNNYQNAQDKYMYKMGNSDGSATNVEGGRNDCSRIEVTATNCSESHILDPYTLGAATDICNDNGYCDPSTATCTCYDPLYSGINCKTIACPTGLAWWAEPVAAQDAHYMATCSNKGDCDHTTGKCICEDGYSGEACQRKDCPGFNSNSGDFCGGNGWCMSMSEIALMYGYSYGSEADGTTFHPVSRVGITSTTGSATDTTPPQTWDAHKWYECVCSNSQSFFDYSRLGNIKHPTVSGSLNINGIPAEGRPLPGYGGYDCKDYLCPTGNNQYNSRYNTLATYTFPNGSYVLGADHLGGYNSAGNSFFEEQLILCTLSTPGEVFQLRFSHNTHVKSLEIGIADQRKEIKRKIEEGLKMGNVSIDFPNIQTDAIETACDASTSVTTGGFVIKFLDALGDLPMLTVVDSAQSASFTVIEKIKGMYIITVHNFICYLHICLMYCLSLFILSVLLFCCFVLYCDISISFSLCVSVLVVLLIMYLRLLLSLLFIFSFHQQYIILLCYPIYI